MLKLDQTPNQALAFEFSKFVKEQQRAYPLDLDDADQEPIIREMGGQAVTQHWNELGPNYVSIETPETFAITMLMLLDHLKTPKGTERWLSVGTGPGFYEMFLARLFPMVTIDSVDQSQRMVNLQATILASQPADVASRINLRLGSIGSLDDPAGLYNRVFAINCLHWVRDWRSGVTNLSRVLSAKSGSPMYLVTAVAAFFDERDRLRPIADGLNQNSLLEELRQLRLHPTNTGSLVAQVGQLGRPASRLYVVGKRVPGQIPDQPPRNIPYEILTEITDDVEVRAIPNIR